MDRRADLKTDGQTDRETRQSDIWIERHRQRDKTVRQMDIETDGLTDVQAASRCATNRPADR